MISAEKFRVRVAEGDAGLRLDQFLAARVPELSRRKARVLLDIGGVFVDRARVKVASRKVKAGQLVEVVMGGALERATKKTGRAARDKDAERLPPHRVLHEDDDLVVVFKPAGLITAPTPESDRGNLADSLSRERGDQPLFVVHRLDLDTSGVLVFAKSDEANRKLGDTFKEHDIERQYYAVVAGSWPEDILRVEAEVDDKHAVSHFAIERHIGSTATLMRVTLETGRTHQIRIHASGVGHPVLGDRQYGTVHPASPPRMALHARLLAFAHPVTGEALRFECELPPDLQGWLDELEAKHRQQA